jgi:hypothetical protein
MKRALAIYDMDRTITRRATYTPFLIHAALRLAPWRLVLIPIALLSSLAYVLKLIDRGRLKEINYTLLIGRAVAPERLEPVIESFADRQVATNIMPGARASIAADRAAGRRLVMATASYRIYAAAIAQRLGFKDVIATETSLDTRAGHRPDRWQQLLRQRQARHDPGLAGARRTGARGRPHPLLFRSHLRQRRPPLVRRTGRHQRSRPAGEAGESRGLEVLDWRR